MAILKTPREKSVQQYRMTQEQHIEVDPIFIVATRMWEI